MVNGTAAAKSHAPSIPAELSRAVERICDQDFWPDAKRPRQPPKLATGAQLLRESDPVEQCHGGPGLVSHG